MIIYDDFAVKIEPRQGDGYPVIVLDSPAGQGRDRFLLPFPPETLGPLLVNLGRAVRRSGLHPSAPTAAQEEGEADWRSPHQIGDQLFRSLFSGRIRTLYDRSLGRIEGQPNRGLRLMLHLDPEHPDLAQLASLPWELLYQKETRDFLSLNRLTPIVRYLDVPRPTRPLPFRPPLRILVVVSSPIGLDPLDLSQERRLIEEAWGEDESVEVHFLEQATTPALRRALLGDAFHVLHYMGHGDFDEATGRGVLLFEDAHGNPEPISGQALATLLQGVGELRLVFLNACDTARTSRRAGVDPFAGVATALVMGGLPAVVAMQFPISDQAAIAFSKEFYHRLAAGDPVDAAVAEGRVATYLANPESLEWGTPVLFMRIPDGRLFDTSTPKQAARSPEDAGEMKAIAQKELPRSRQAPQPQGEKRRSRAIAPWQLAAGALALGMVAILVFAFLNRGGPSRSPVEIVAFPSPTQTTMEATESGAAMTLTPTATGFQPPATPVPHSSNAITAENASEMVELARLGRGTLNQMTFSPDGQTLAVASSLGIWLYNVENPETPKLIVEDTGQVHGVAWSPDSSTLASAHADGTIRLWDTPGGDERGIWRGHTDAVWAVAWSPDGTQLASGSGDETVRVWDAAEGHRLQVLAGHTGRVQSVAWSPDNKRLASGGMDHTVRVWNTDTGQEIHVLTSHENLIRQVAWSPDGAWLASGASADGTVRVWDADSGQELWKLRGDGIAWSPDGKQLAVGRDDGTLQIWDLADERTLLTLDGHAGLVGLVAWSPEGTRLASGGHDNTIRMWNIADGGGSTELATYGAPMSSVDWSSDGSLVAAGSEDGAVWLWNLATGQEQRLQGGSSPVQSIAWAADSGELRVGDASMVHVWDVTSGEILRRLDQTGSMAWSPDGSQFVARDVNDTMRVWELATGTELQVLDGHTDFVWQAAWSPDGTRLATGSSDNTVRIWEVVSGEAVAVLEDQVAYLDDPEGGDVLSVAWSPDGSRLVSGTRDGTVRVWDVGTQEIVLILKSRTPVQSLAWSHHGSLLALGGYDGFVQLWDIARGTELGRLTGHTDAVLSVAWSPDGSRLASGGGDGTVRVWGIPDKLPPSATGHIIYQLSEGKVYRIAAQPEATPENVSLALDRLAPGSADADPNIAPDGKWLILSTDRFDTGCVGWPCLAIVAGDLSSGEAVRADGDLLHPAGSGAVASGGDLIVYPADNTAPHTRDLWAVVRSGDIWSKPLLLTGKSPYDWHEQPAITADGKKVVFECGPTYGGAGTAICEVGTDGTAFRVVITPEEGPEGTKQNGLHHPDYESDGSIVFDADWRGSQQIWRLPAGTVDPVRIVLRNEAENDGTPCVLPDGRIASLWNWPPQIKVMTPDGDSFFSLSPSTDVLDVGLGCGE